MHASGPHSDQKLQDSGLHEDQNLQNSGLQQDQVSFFVPQRKTRSSEGPLFLRQLAIDLTEALLGHRRKFALFSPGIEPVIHHESR